jgi:hypothetical protein
VAIDSLVGAHKVDFAIIDAQGTDQFVVAGMAGVIARWHPPMLVEFWPEGIREAGAAPLEVLDRYRQLGYVVTVVDAPELGDAAAGTDILAAAEANRGGYVDLFLSRPG